MSSSPDARPDEPSLRFVLWTAVALLVAYHGALVVAFALLPSPRIGLFLAGPLLLLVPLLAGVPSGMRRPALRLRAVPLPSVLSAAAATVALLPAFFVAGSLFLPEPDALQELLAEILRVGSGREAVLVLGGACLAPAFSEEIFFRGFVQRGLERRLGRWGGILVTAAVFGILHGAARAPVIGVLGLLFGWMASRTGSVAPSIVAHAATNGIAVGIVNVPGLDSWEPATAAEAVTILAAGAVAGTWLLVVFARSLTSGEGSDPTPSGEAPPRSRPPA